MSDGDFQTIIFPEGLEEWNGIKLKPMTGIEKIAQERREQKVTHGKTILGDYQQYPDFELATLAEAIIADDIGKVPDCFSTEAINKIWTKSYEQKLVIAGALLAAEIDRLNFKE